MSESAIVILGALAFFAGHLFGRRGSYSAIIQHAEREMVFTVPATSFPYVNKTPRHYKIIEISEAESKQLTWGTLEHQPDKKYNQKK